ncbi:hypothetical protein CMO90_01395 [Candidatus Woesearchaeota archaeon]|jgi:hypothetical protein|nr:hypothetical protein [Candidatus Woesearchaeota archaeon]|tara:strand:+ start:636 stop:1019 length:384 start_codon:yes stop_codon:yes gene_type:complete
MSFIDKLMFWKKDDFDMDMPLDSGDPTDNLGLNTEQGLESKTGIEQEAKNLGLEPVTNSFSEKTGSLDSPSSFQQKPSNNTIDFNKDFDLISSKLDTIKAELDAMNQRLQKIEKSVDKKDEEKKDVW